MNSRLEQLATQLKLLAPESRMLALAFGLACSKRIEHLLEEPEVVDCLKVLGRYVAGEATAGELDTASEAAAVLANRHRGSKSIDGCGHAAVSATYGISKAMAGKAVEAAEYCAYAAIYASGGYAAVADREAFEPEYAWQARQLAALAEATASSPASQWPHEQTT
ncbi:MAG: hypothetical protein H7346_18110 [Burkholderiaceae bacterium]|nr:hypothetical protein [Burkholderiaceae bacterium]